MNVAFISTDPEVPIFGHRGCSVHAQEVLRALMKRGFQVDLFSSNFGGAVTEEFASVRVHSIAAQKRERLSEQERAALANNAAIRDLLSRSHRERNYQYVYERHALWNFAGMEFARETDIPGILEINSPLLEERTSRHLLVDRAGAEDAVMRAFRSATVIRCVSQQLAHIIEKHPSARGKVHVIKNAVNGERFAWSTPTLEREPDTFVIGYTGELRSTQGLTTLISAFQLVVDALPYARLVIVGDGEEREALEREIAARDLTKVVKFTGTLPPHQMPGTLASFDAAVVPLPAVNGYYGSPLKVFEYMATGLPIVASKVGQVQDVLRDGETAILVPPADRETLAQALYDLAESPELRQKLGEAARAQALSNHSWDAVIEQVFERARVREPVVVPKGDTEFLTRQQLVRG